MKKIFTLISMAMVAMSMNAQSEPEFWEASKNLTFAEVEGQQVLQNMTKSANTTATLKKVPTTYNLPGGDQPDEATVRADATAVLSLDDYTFTGSTANVTVTGVATPNSGTEPKEIWKMAGANNVLLTEANLGEQCLIPFEGQYVVSGNGNPALETYEYYFMNSDPKEVGPRYYETYWSAGNLPLKGCYYKFSVKAQGTMIIGFFLNKNLNANSLILLDGATKAPVAKDKILISAFRQNCNFEGEQLGENPVTTHVVPYTLDDNGLVQYEHLDLGGTNRPLYGYMSFDTEANKDYYMFSPKSQMGLYGFYFQAEGGSGIETVKAQTNNANAPVYNLAGQQVAKNFKGMVIQNGKKFVVK